MGKEGSASFFKKIEAKKLRLWLRPQWDQSPKWTKVFCFFFSKKKRLLACSALSHG
jgi:hypothetical protein